MLKKIYISLLTLFICSELMSQNQDNDSAKDSLIRILKTDSNNYSANYKLGILYYEQAVKIIRETPYEIDLIALEKIQDESVELFRKALPHLEKAYQLNPAKREILFGLSALYFSLNELEKAEEIEKRNTLELSPQK